MLPSSVRTVQVQVGMTPPREARRSRGREPGTVFLAEVASGFGHQEPGPPGSMHGNPVWMGGSTLFWSRGLVGPAPPVRPNGNHGRHPALGIAPESSGDLGGPVQHPRGIPAARYPWGESLAGGNPMGGAGHDPTAP